MDHWTQKAEELAKLEYAAYLQKLAVLLQAQEKLTIAKAGLNMIACWDEGPVVKSSFDEPRSAQIALDTLKNL